MNCLKGGKVKQRTGAVASTIGKVLVTVPGQTEEEPARSHPTVSGTSKPHQSSRRVENQNCGTVWGERKACEKGISNTPLVGAQYQSTEERKGAGQEAQGIYHHPFSFTKRLLGQKKSGSLTCPVEEINHHLNIIFSDPLREHDLGPCSSGVPYRVYKQCPKLLVQLWKIMKVIWCKERVTTQGRSAEGVWIPKEEDASNIEQFRLISLLCVEGKIFFKIVSQRLTDFLLKNGYIDTSVQKGVPGVPGCLEHTEVDLWSSEPLGRKSGADHPRLGRPKGGKVKQRTGAVASTIGKVLVTVPGQTEEEPGPEPPHSVWNLQATPVLPPSGKSERRVKWPAANNKEWLQLDEDIDKIMATTGKGNVDHKLQAMCTFITIINAERFGVKERPVRKESATPNWWEHKISQLRKGKERAKKRKAFITNLFSFTKRLLGQKKSGSLTCPVEEINHHLNIIFSDPLREQDLGPCEALVKPPEPVVQFNTTEPTQKEVKEAVMAARSSSSPGSSGVPYRVCKQCPKLKCEKDIHIHSKITTLPARGLSSRSAAE
ncbi:hypothetical protein D4764_03G0011370 [Takifugu flavidus]|uniref:Uncharacterized protein n=1 Tax=Takifugu flavidus TaxID=433684 RepID=A0A5C6NBC4_9TELE|nr:hypothetical protein D4764_03G0011370 [Takifugu flavidus]